MAFDSPQTPAQFQEIEELSGSLSPQNEENKLMRSVLQNDKENIDTGNLINQSLNQGISSFTPDVMFDKLVSNYSLAKKIYGETLLRLATGYNPDYVKKNIGIPEFRKALQEQMRNAYEDLQHKGHITNDGSFSEQGIKLASLVLYTEELDHVVSRGFFGEKMNKKNAVYGSKDEIRNYRKGDRYRDIALKKSVKRALRRSHTTLLMEDLQSYEREGKGKATIVYALDTSSSMKGEKLEACKKAGVALAFKAIMEKDEVGLIIFGAGVKHVVEPTTDFMKILLEITKARASRETDIASTLRASINLFPQRDVTKHLILLTDALPTKGDKPLQDTEEEAARAWNNGITISLIGIHLDEEGKKLGERITKIGNGRFSTAQSTKNVDQIVLQDYYALS